MLFDAPSAPPSKGWERDDTGGHTRAEPRLSEIPVKRSLLPLGSPFGWSARDRALYVQFLTALLLVVVTLSFVVFDGWPFLLEVPDDTDALHATTAFLVGATAFWVSLYVSTWWRLPKTPSEGFPWVLLATVGAHILTGTAVCYAIGPYTAASGLIMVAALLLGMVLLRRLWLWLAVVAWLASMLALHFASKAGWLPFLALFQASLEPLDLAKVAAERAVASALVYIPLALVMDHLISVWRRDEQSFYEAAQFDSLTGAYTRGFAVAVMQRALAKAAEEDKPVAVLMVDLDHFKRINDAHGHQRGDRVLAETGHAIQSTLRTDDVVARFGGEEFVVLLPGADLAQAIRAAERCRAAVQRMRIPDAPHLEVTASVGVAAFPDDGEDLDVLLRASDRAMYRAKANGRNRVECAMPTRL